MALRAASTPGASGPHCSFCNWRGHTPEQCSRLKEVSQQAQKDTREAYKKRKGKGRGKDRANAAQDSAETTQKAEFAGNASLLLDHSSPKCLLISDAGADWNTDTGATCHMTPHRHWFHSYTPQSTPIRLANGQTIYSAGIGAVRFQPSVNGKPGQLLEFH